MDKEILKLSTLIYLLIIHIDSYQNHKLTCTIDTLNASKHLNFDFKS